MTKICLITVFVFLLFSVTTYGWEIAVGPTYQDLEISGKFKSNGTEIVTESDLGLDDDQTIGVNVRLDQGRHHLTFDFASVDFSAAKTLTRTIQFQNKTYNISTSVSSKVEYDLYEFQYHFDVIGFEESDAGISLAPLIKVNVFDADLNIQGSGQDETYTETLPIPTIGVIGHVDITEYISLLAQCSGIGYSGDTFIEYRGAVRVKPIKYLSIDVGYKGMELDYTDSDNLLDIEVEGFFVQGAFVLEF